MPMSCQRSSGAMQKLAEARINNELASEIASMKPVQTNMGLFDFLPFDVPFLEQVSDLGCFFRGAHSRMGDQQWF